MLFVSNEPVVIEINNIQFRVKPLSGADVIKLLGKKGFTNFSELKGEDAVEIVNASVVDFTVDGKVYGKEYLNKLNMNIYAELLTKVVELNFGVEKNFQKMKD